MTKYVTRILLKGDVVWGDTIEAANPTAAKSKASNSFFAAPSLELKPSSRLHIMEMQQYAMTHGMEITARVSKAK